ncbi:restriction endonuclease subunit S [Helicobacter pylori]|nr:restriction endonuclease subunit S [Helicobacter pylori]
MDALTTPSNWQKIRLGDIGITISGLAGKTKQDFINGNAKYITFLNVLNNVIIDTSILENVKIYPNEKQNSFKKYDLFFNTSSETPKEVGMCAVLLDDIDQVFLNSFCFGFRIFDKAVDSLFLSYLINSEIGRKAFENLAQGSTRYNLSKSGFNNVCLILPPLDEQIAIANILSDLDHYLCALDALILKKEGVKKALSFELLSQRKRLKGFNQAWQRVKVKDFGIIITGSTPLTQISEYWNGTISWITPTDINDNKDIFNSERKITQKGLNTIRMIPKNSVLVTCIASIGKNAILRVNGACNQQINAIIPNKDFNADFIYYLMENNKQYLLGKAGVTATYIISKQVFEEIDFFVPKDLNEQSAIANILSALDNEITSLKNKKRQFENIKKALNHDLMSAKIRVLEK